MTEESLNPSKRQVVSEFRRAGILKAARKVFARRGYDGATMDDVAEACSIAKGTLYLYFKSKRQIYLGVLKQDLQSLREETTRAVANAASAGDKIHAFIMVRFDFANRHRDFFRIYNTDISAAFLTAQPMQKEIRDFYLQQASMLTAIISEGIRGGELRDLPAQSLAFAIYDMTRACIARRVLGLGEPSDADAGALIDFIWRGIARV